MQVLEQGKLNLQLGIDAERRESPIFQMPPQLRSRGLAPTASLIDRTSVL